MKLVPQTFAKGRFKCTVCRQTFKDESLHDQSFTDEVLCTSCRLMRPNLLMSIKHASDSNLSMVNQCIIAQLQNQNRSHVDKISLKALQTLLNE